MAHGHAHEEAGHATHHAHDPFDRRVAMSMVVIAAVLAAVKVLGHRTHNDTLAYQIKSGVAQSQAGAYHTQESDQWNLFQSKKMREVLARQEAKLLLQQALRGGPPDGKAEKAAAPGLPNREKRLAALRKELEDEKVENAGAEAKKIHATGEKRLGELVR